MAASVSLSSFWIFKAGGLDTDGDTATWRLKLPTAADTITWNIGPNTLDASTFALVTATEPKFNFAANGTPLTRTLVGLSARQVGAPAGTVAASAGTGSSAPVPGTLYGTNYECAWNLSLSVTPGTPASAVSYDASMEADDPIGLTAQDFADNSAGRTSLYIPVRLDRLNHATGGGMSVSYVTDAGRTELLALQSAGGTVTARSGEPGLARYYLIDDPNENPMAQGMRPYSLADLRDLLSARMQDGVLTRPVMLGVLLENVPVPRVPFGTGGLVAEVHVASRVFEAVQSRAPRMPQGEGRPRYDDPAQQQPQRRAPGC